MPNRQPTGAIVDRLRNNSSQDWRWVVPWAMFNDAEEHSSREIIEATADAIEQKPERTCRNVSTVGHNSSGWLFDFKCSECGAELCAEEMGNSPLWIDEEAEPISYCPSCGAKVVDDGD